MFEKIKKLINARKVNIMKKRFGNIGSNVIISSDSVFGDPQNISLGSNIYIGPGADIWATGGLIVENGAGIGPHVTIHTSNHRYEEASAIPYDGVTYLKSVRICQNALVFANVIIVPGVTIHEGAVVMMGSVVTKDVPKGAIVGGNPATIVKYRDLERYEKLKAEGKNYFKLKAEGKVVWEFIRG